MTPPTGGSRDTRQRLLEAAGEVFADRGFRDATIKEICRRADANIAAVHYHFGDKEEFYRTVIQYAEQCAPENSPADRAPDAPAEKRLRAHIESFLVRLFDEGQPAWRQGDGAGDVRAPARLRRPRPGEDVRRELGAGGRRGDDACVADLKIDDRRIHPGGASQNPGRSSPRGPSPAPRRPPAGRTDPPGATRPSSPDAWSGAPVTHPLQLPLSLLGRDVRVRDLTVQRVREFPGDPRHGLRPRSGEFVYPAQVRPRVGEDGRD